jgi:hypothetical protein
MRGNVRRKGAIWDRRDSEKGPKGVFYLQDQYEYRALVRRKLKGINVVRNYDLVWWNYLTFPYLPLA